MTTMSDKRLLPGQSKIGEQTGSFDDNGVGIKEGDTVRCDIYGSSNTTNLYTVKYFPFFGAFRLCYSINNAGGSVGLDAMNGKSNKKFPTEVVES